MKILIDVDDVCLDFIPNWINLYNKKSGDNLKPGDINSWEISEYVKEEWKDKIYTLLDELELYDGIEPIHNASNSISILRQMGHDIKFVTSKNHPSKYRLLNIHLFTKDFSEYIVEKDKYKIDGDILVDDNEKNCKKFVENNPKRKSILYTCHHNKNALFVGNIYRANNWTEVTEYIIKWTNENEGYKLDVDKDKWHLLDMKALREILKVRMYGAKKYAPQNYAKGMDYSKLYNATLRHLMAWWEGEDIDPESGLHHLGHAGCCILFLLVYATRPNKYKKFDDRGSVKILDD